MIKWEWKIGLKDLFWLVALIALAVWGISTWAGMNTQLEEQRIETKRLSDELIRASTELVNRKDLERFSEQLGMDYKAIKKDISNLDARLVAVGRTVALIKANVQKDGPSDYTRPHSTPNRDPDSGTVSTEVVALPDIPLSSACTYGCDIYGYASNVHGKYIRFGDIPFATVEFDASKEDPWSVWRDEIEVIADTVLSEQDKSGLFIFHHEIKLRNNTRPELKDKEFKLKLVESKFLQLDPKTRTFYWWVPRLDISIDNVLVFSDNIDYRPGASLGFSVMGYGKSRNLLDLRVIRLGLGFNWAKKPVASFEPVMYNLGKHIPLIQDLWIGPAVTFDSNWGMGLMLGTTL